LRLPPLASGGSLNPAGFEKYFPEAAALFSAAQPSLPDPAQAAALQARYALQMDFASIPRLAQTYGLTAIARRTRRGFSPGRQAGVHGFSPCFTASGVVHLF
jgi:hypothetical protein